MRRSSHYGVLLASLLAAPSAGAADYINDPLTAATFAGRGSMGGSFGANGWTTVNEPDAFWYEIADAIPTGSIEYTVTGLSVGGTLNGVDHDILTFYQAPTGKPEPIPYSPWFRNNDFKAFTRIFGDKEPGRGGAMKLELAFCPRGEPWYHDTACTPGCDKSGIAYARGMDKDVGWDASKSYRMTMSWEPGKIAFSRDGETLGTIAFAGTYGAKPLRVRFGSPRHDGVYPGAAYMPKGLVFKDVKISGTPGAMTMVCGATVPDAGVTDTSVSDAAVLPGEISVLQDVTAASYEMGVFPDVTDLNPEGSATPAVAYLKFPPIAGVPTNVKLRLHTHDFPSASGGSGVVCVVDDDAWTETTLKWTGRPAVGTTCAGVSRKVDADSDVEFDLTALFAAASTASRNLAIVSTDPDGVHYLSKEKDKARGPRLVVTGGGVIIPPDSGATDAGGDTTMTPVTDSTAENDARGGNDRVGEDLEGSCGCRTAGGGGSSTPGLVTLLSFLAYRLASRRASSRRTRSPAR